MNTALSYIGLGLLLDATLKVTLIIGLAFLATYALRRSAASMRQLAWNLTFCGVLALPFLAMLLPNWKSSWLPSVFLGSGMEEEATTMTGACVALVDSSLMGFLGFLGQHIQTPLGAVSAANLVLSVWVLGAAALLIKALFENLLLHIGFHRAHRETDGRLWHILRDASLSVGLRSIPGLAVGRFGVPATFGTIRPKVILPEEAREWSDERLRVVLLHEAAHIKNLDYPFNIAAQVVCSLLWHNPLSWFAARQLRLERECAADDLVISTGERGVEYAQHLYEIAQASRGRALSAAAAVAMAHHCSLKTRVTQILDPTTRRISLSRGRMLVLGCLFTVMLAPLAAMQPNGPASFDCFRACQKQMSSCDSEKMPAVPAPAKVDKKPCEERKAERERKCDEKRKKKGMAKKDCDKKQKSPVI